MQYRVVELYETYHQENGLLLFLRTKGLQVKPFHFFKRPKKKFKNKAEIVIQEIYCLIKLVMVFNKLRHDQIVCMGGHYSFLLLTKLLAPILPKDYHLYIYNFYLHGLGENPKIRKVLKFLLHSRKTTLVVQSSSEVSSYFPLTASRPHFVPYCEDLDFQTEDSLAPDFDYLFSGGYTNRDYQLLVKCAQKTPDIQFVFVTSKLNQEIADTSNLPSNITIFREVNRSEFYGILRRSKGVIIPLKEDVGSSGQMLCIGAMKYKRPVVFCDIPAINYYFANGQYGIPYTIGNIDSLTKAVLKLWNSRNNTDTLVDEAYLRYQSNYTLAQRNDSLYNIIISNGRVNLQ